MKKKEKDELLAAHMPTVLHYHQTMLADGLRNKLLYAAIRSKVTPETQFLDIGAGTGVWAILAAKLGAKRVVAVEIEECLIPLIYKHAQENGVADRIEIIHANSNDVRIRGRFDLIVSELFGGDALGVETVKSFVRIRDRFLAPGGVLIPQKLTMMAVPVHFENSIDKIPAEIPLEMSFMRSLKLNYGQSVAITDRSRLKFLAEPKKLAEIDFHRVKEPPSLANLTASWKMKSDLRQVNAIATFNHSTFTDEIEMDAFGSQSWGVGINEFVPFERRSGELRFMVTMDPKQGNWSVSLPSHPDEKQQNYAPVFAFTRIRMSQQTTPHRRFRAVAKPEKNE